MADPPLIDAARRATLLMAASALLAPASAVAADAPSASATDGRHDFDFLYGDWEVHHRKFQRVTGAWVEFKGRSTTRPLLGGLANLETATIGAPGGTYEGIALRLFDPTTNQWSIWWADEHAPSFGHSALVGSFTNHTGTLYDLDTSATPHQVTRFIWSHITPSTARWEQALSIDDRATWETNWVMDFRRTAA